jgi:hypothetical protein
MEMTRINIGAALYPRQNLSGPGSDVRAAQNCSGLASAARHVKAGI